MEFGSAAATGSIFMIASIVFWLHSRRGVDLVRSCAISAACLVLLTPAVRAQDQSERTHQEPFSTGSSLWDGYAEFVRLAQHQLGTERVILTKQLNYSELTPLDALMIVHPKSRLDESSLNAFLVDGGRIALLDDYGRGDQFLRNFGIVTRAAPSDPYETLRGNPHLPIASPSLQLAPGSTPGRHPVAAGVERVVTNHPRAFEHPDLTTVLDIVDQGGVAHPLAVTGVIAQKGRLFALADPSVFINFMLRYPDNRSLAQGLIRYLAETYAAPNESQKPSSQGGPSSRVFIVTNDFSEQGHYGAKHSLRDKLDAAFDDSLQAFDDIKDNGITKELALALSVLLSLWILSSLLKRFLRLPQVLLPSYSAATPLAAQLGPASRADVLRSRHASPVLALMELDSALREAVSRRLLIDGGATPKLIAERSLSLGLSAEDAQRLDQVLSTLAMFGTSLAHGKPKRISEKELKGLHQQVIHLLKVIETNKMRPGSN